MNQDIFDPLFQLQDGRLAQLDTLLWTLLLSANNS
jgi:hypothetical protein